MSGQFIKSLNYVFNYFCGRCVLIIFTLLKHFMSLKHFLRHGKKAQKLQTAPFYRLKDGIADMHEVHIYFSFIWFIFLNYKFYLKNFKLLIKCTKMIQNFLMTFFNFHWGDKWVLNLLRHVLNYFFSRFVVYNFTLFLKNTA